MLPHVREPDAVRRGRRTKRQTRSRSTVPAANALGWVGGQALRFFLKLYSVSRARYTEGGFRLDLAFVTRPGPARRDRAASERERGWESVGREGRHAQED